MMSPARLDSSSVETDVTSIADQPERPLLDRLLRLISYSFCVDEALVLFPGQERHVLAGSEPEIKPLLEALGGWNSPGMVLDVWHDERIRSLLANSNWRFLAGVPVMSESVAVAYLMIVSRSPRSVLASPDMNALADFACVVGSLLELRMAASEALNAECKAQESESRFRSTANSTPLLIWTATPDAFWSFVNLAWADFTGGPDSELLGEGWLDLVHPEDRSSCQEAWVAAVAKRAPFQMEHRLRSHSGGYRWVVNQALPRFLPNGDFNGFAGSCTDVTHLHFDPSQAAAATHASIPGWEISSALTILLDPSGRIVTLNQAAAAIMQLNPQMSLHKRIWNVLPNQQDRPAMREAVHAALGLKRACTIQTDYQNEQGDEVSICWTLQAQAGPDGRVEHILCSGRDTSAERRIAQSLRRVAAVVDSSDDAIYHTNRSGTILTWNAAAERMFGYTEREIVGQFTSLLIPPDCISEFELLLTRIDAGESVVRRVSTRLHKDGHRVPVAVTASAVRDESGRVIGKVVVARDLTQEKQRETELRKKDALCRALVENAIDVVALLDSAGTIVFTSPSCKRLFGYDPEEMVGKSRYEFYHPNDLEESRALFEDATASPGGTRHARLRFHRKDGSWCKVETRLTNLLDETELCGVLVNARIVED